MTMPPPKTAPTPPTQVKKPIAPFSIDEKVKRTKLILIRSRRFSPKLKLTLLS